VVAGRPVGSVTFVEDDITASTLEPATFDLIVSFEVLEHVARPADAFAAMARLLRPGGVMFHDYNPFFSTIGGHSLSTLDLPWGHARLSDDDVERYLREMRPAEVEQALRFYRDSLNRMTLADLRDAIAGAGLESVAIIPWHQRSLLARQPRRSSPRSGPSIRGSRSRTCWRPSSWSSPESRARQDQRRPRSCQVNRSNPTDRSRNPDSTTSSWGWRVA
jgi:SAM-dependent methyltransferase